MESAGTVLGFVVVEVWQKRLVIVIDIYPSKTDTSWKIERWMIHSVVFSFDDHRRYIFILI
jgi:hypothetical protein